MPLADTLLAALPESQRWTARPTLELLTPLPNSPAVYLLVADGDAPVQLGTTQQLRRLIASRLIAVDDTPTVRADLGEIVRGVIFRPVSSTFEATWWYYRLARHLHPRDYRKMIGFGPAHFLHVNFAGRLPEVRVADQIWRSPGEFVGPFASQRAAQQALEVLWDLFDLCRTPEQYRKLPSGSRCAYADMGRCDAPCDGAVPPGAIIERTHAAWRFASDGASAWLDEATQRMRQLATAQQFEQAAQVKQQIAAARNWLATIAPRVTRESELRFLIAIPATRRAAWKLFWFSLGEFTDGPLIATRKLAAELPNWITLVLASAPAVELDPVVRMEQTWLIARLIEPSDKPRVIVVRVRADSTAVSLSESLLAAIDEFRGSDEPEEKDWPQASSSDAIDPPASTT